MENYLFLYLKTGGGHLAPAKAIAEKIKNMQLHNVETHLVDCLAEANNFVRRTIEDGYSTSINKVPWIYEMLYGLHKFKPISWLSALIVGHFVKPYIETQILEKQARKIVIFHFFLVKPVFEILKKHNLDIPVITVVTDPFTAHPIWFLRKNQQFVVFSNDLKIKCLANGIPKENLQVFPFVLNENFTHELSPTEKLKIREELGFDSHKKIILMMGGADGMPRGYKILRHILKKNMEAEIAIICGKNQRLQNQAIELKKQYPAANLKVYGYIDFVYKLINISDVVITKCGASTFMEILLLGKVPVINNYIWEQEKGNKDFVCDNNMGIFEKSIKKLPKVLNSLITNETKYNTLISNILQAKLQNGTEKVTNFILN